MTNEFLSPAQAGKLCDTSYNSIKRWVKAGKLKGHKTPGGYHKISKNDLFSMMKEYDIPIPDEFEIARKKILIVDDDEHVRESIMRYLRMNGNNFEVTSAKDGFEAGILVTQFKPDLIVLDLMIPKMDGFSVCKNLKSNPKTKDIIILVLTGFSTEENIQRAKDCGADVVLTKPIREEELLKGIEALVQ